MDTLDRIREEQVANHQAMIRDGISPKEYLAYLNRQNHLNTLENIEVQRRQRAKYAAESSAFGAFLGMATVAPPAMPTKKAAPAPQKPSPIFGIHVNKLSGIPRKFPAELSTTVQGLYRTSGILLASYNNYTNLWIEKAILYCVLRTKFVDYVVTRGRYQFNFNMFDKRLIEVLLKYILTCKVDRINYSWVAPLQDLILFDKKPIKLFKPPRKAPVEYKSPGITIKARPFSGGILSDISAATSTDESYTGQQIRRSAKTYTLKHNPWTSENATEPQSPSISAKLPTDSKPLDF